MHGNSKPRTEDILVIIIAAAAIAAAAYCTAAKLLKADWLLASGPCAIKVLTGWYCPGCGGTRAVKALLRGDIAASIIYHPVVAYTAGFIFIFMGSQLLRYASHGRIRGLKYRNIYLYIAAGLFALNFLVKNIGRFLR